MNMMRITGYEKLQAVPGKQLIMSRKISTMDLDSAYRKIRHIRLRNTRRLQSAR